MTKIYSASSFSRAEAQLNGEIKQVSERDYFVELKVPFFNPWLPGQFLMLQWGTHVVGRPFAITDWRQNEDGSSLLKFWFRVLGAGTKDLVEHLKNNRKVYITTPLGSVPPYLSYANRILYISGGVGAASLLPMIEARRRNSHSDFWVHGERDLGSLVKTLNPDLVFVEEVAGVHKKGRVTRIFEEPSLLGDSTLQDFDALVCCGPTPMLAALQKLCTSLDLKCFMGLEEKMACGLGLCFSCSVKTNEGMQRCCLEGPWFESTKILQHFEFRSGALKP